MLRSGETSSEQEIVSFCEEQIAHYEIPRFVRFVAELPMTVTGKAQKFAMRDAMISELGLVVATTA